MYNYVVETYLITFHRPVTEGLCLPTQLITFTQGKNLIPTQVAKELVYGVSKGTECVRVSS